MIARLKAFITTYANSYLQCKSRDDILISSLPASSYLSSLYHIFGSVFFFSKHITHKIRRLITACQQRPQTRRQIPRTCFSLRAFYSNTPGILTPRHSWRQVPTNASRRQLPELLITCGNGLINVKVCIKSVKAVSDDVGQAIDRRLGDSL